MSPDAVVIGSGPNGLVAANVLADAGWDVLVLEAEDTPGGAVRSAEITAPGFVSDLYSAFYPLGAGSPVIAGLGLADHGLRWRHAPEVQAHLFPDDRVALLSRDVEVTAASLASFAAEDGPAWRREVDAYQGIKDDLLDALLRPFPPVRAGMRLLRHAGLADALRGARTLTLTARRFGNERFAGDGAKALISGNAMHTDLSAEQAGGAVFGWLLAMLGQDVGFPVPEGGAGALVDALVRRLESRGGRVECGRPVTEVVVRGGKALGVIAGEPVRARKAVLADVPAPALYLDLVGAQHLPARLVTDLADFAWDDATVKIDWALSAPIPWTAPDVARAGTVHLGVDLDGFTDVGAALAVGRVPERPFLLLGQMSTADPTRSPADTESAWLYSHVPRGGDWPEERLRTWAAGVEATMEHHAPGFTDLVVGRVVSGPADLQRGNRSLVEGAIGGGTSAIQQQLVFRPTPGLGRADTPVGNLFLASSSAHPGGGVHGAPGANAARAALAASGWTGPAYRALIRTAMRATTGE
jgi:phytoene dehydrogenase-like protein